MFVLKSKGIIDGWIQKKYGKQSSFIVEGVPTLSIPLNWENPPKGSKTFVLVFQDYDNVPDEGFSWIHWLVADMPYSKEGLKENESRDNPDLIQGKNSWIIPFEKMRKGENITNFYGGPSPENVHEYEFRLYALDTALDMRPGFYLNHLLKAMEGHVLGDAVLRGKYAPV